MSDNSEKLIDQSRKEPDAEKPHVRISVRGGGSNPPVYSTHLDAPPESIRHDVIDGADRWWTDGADIVLTLGSDPNVVKESST